MTPQELKAARKRLRLTQKEFALQIAMSHDSVKSMELGRKPITPRTVKLVRALTGDRKVKTYELFKKMEDGGLEPLNREVQAQSAADAARMMGLEDWYEREQDTVHWEDLRVLPEDLW